MELCRDVILHLNTRSYVSLRELILTSHLNCSQSDRLSFQLTRSPPVCLINCLLLLHVKKNCVVKSSSTIFHILFDKSFHFLNGTLIRRIDISLQKAVAKYEISKHSFFSLRSFHRLVSFIIESHRKIIVLLQPPIF